MTTLVPHRGDFPDFLTPSDTDSFSTSLDLIHATPAARLHTELALRFRRRTPPPWARRLAEGDHSARCWSTRWPPPPAGHGPRGPHRPRWAGPAP
ncbi:hypothetical protein ACFWMU_32250 [Streptomyces sp. NPDC058357]|uniref:hypothetical protein n=1 Tax=unclassified Streptomyces TaxID=2593676 RepID=UPI00365E0890